MDKRLDYAILVMDKYLQRHNLSEALIESMAVEKDAISASLINAAYGHRSDTASPPFPIILFDVLHLIRSQGLLLKTWIQRLPEGTLVIIAFGSPCQDFTIIGRFFGALGWHGSRSSLIFIPASFS